MQRHTALPSGRPATTISCMKILPSWPNEAKNSCVFRQLNCVIYLGQHKRRSDAPLQDLPRMRNAARLRAKPAPSLSGRHRRHPQRRTATSTPNTALPPFLWRRSARCRSRSISCVRSARPWRCSFGRRGRDQRANGWARFQSSVPCDFLSALRPARAVPAHRRRGDGADRQGLLSGCDTTKTRFIDKLIGGSRTALAARRALERRPRSTGPGADLTYDWSSTASSSAMRPSAGRAGVPRTSVTAGRQDGA